MSRGSIDQGYVGDLKTPVSAVYTHSFSQRRLCGEYIKHIMVVSLPELPVKFVTRRLVHCMPKIDPQP